LSEPGLPGCKDLQDMLINSSGYFYLAKRYFMNIPLAAMIMFLIAGTTSVRAEQIKKNIDRGGYGYIPPIYLTDSTLGIIYNYNLLYNEEKSFSIFWGSACIDGRYNLRITPEQIYLNSSHENPNPSYLYWILTIDNSTYQQILKGFQKEGKQSSYFDESYDEFELADEHTINCDSLLEEQVDKFFAYMNKFIVNNKQKLNKAKRIIPPKAILYDFDRRKIEFYLKYLKNLER
jgi:hypothetical protein